MTITEARATSAFVDRNLYSLTTMGDYMVGLGGNLPAGGSLWGGRAPMVEGYPYTGGVLGGCPGGAVLVSRKKGGKKSVPKLSRLGELLNTQKNVHTRAPGGPPRGAYFGPPRGPPISVYNHCTQGPKNGLFGGPGRALPGAPRGPPGRGARGAAPGGPGGRAPPGAPRGPPRGAPLGPPKRGPSQ